MKRRSLATAVLVFSMLMASNSHSQSTWASQAIQARSLTDEALFLERGWASGYLRVAVTPIAPNWALELDYGNAGKLLLNAATVGPRLESREDDRLILQVPIVPEAILFARATSTNVKVLPLAVVIPSYIMPEQKIPGSDVISIARDEPSLPQAVLGAFARADVMTQQGSTLAVCTAFRISQGLWLTAAHCAFRPADQPNLPTIGSLRLQLDAYASQLPLATPMTGKVIASGVRNLSQGTASLLQSDDLDYAVLEVKDDPGGPALNLNEAQAAQKDTKLRLYQYWLGEGAPLPGKAYSTGGQCAVLEPLPYPEPAKPAICGLQHGCSSRTGASGSPLIDSGNNRLVGLHYGEGLRNKFNCGLTIAVIRTDLCQRAPDVARKAFQCP